MRKIEMVGQRFGRLLVIEETPRPIHFQHKEIFWKCQCDCGGIVSLTGCNLRAGITKSCGCLQIETVKKQMTTHGYSNTNIAYTFAAAKQRAKRFNVPFDLTIEYVAKLLAETKVCPLLETELIIGVYGDSPSLDRLIPEKGYVIGNVQIISQRANAMKSDASITQLTNFVKNIMSYVNNIGGVINA